MKMHTNQVLFYKTMRFEDGIAGILFLTSSYTELYKIVKRFWNVPVYAISSTFEIVFGQRVVSPPWSSG